MNIGTHISMFQLSVLRDVSYSADTTLGGVTSTHKRLALVGTIPLGTTEIHPITNAPTLALRSDSAPVVLQAKQGFGRVTASLVPLVYDAEQAVWSYKAGRFMAGGNYAATSDSRVTDIISAMLGHRFYGALAVHDRYEK